MIEKLRVLIRAAIARGDMEHAQLLCGIVIGLRIVAGELNPKLRPRRL